MELKRVPISQIISWDRNPRSIKAEDYERLKRQMARLGIYKPLVCAEEGGKYVVLGGNMRLRALRELGHTEADISVVHPKTEAEKLEFNLSDNDRAGEYDETKLAEMTRASLGEIELEDYKVDLFRPIGLKSICEAVGPPLDPNKEWTGMPEFVQGDVEFYKGLVVRFLTKEDFEEFARLIGQSLTEGTKSIWFPKRDWDEMNREKGYIDES